MSNDADAAFRRLLERATADPDTAIDIAAFTDPTRRSRREDLNDEAEVVPLVHAQPSHQLRRVLPYAAAVAVLIGGTVAALSNNADRVRTVPAATGTTVVLHESSTSVVPASTSTPTMTTSTTPAAVPISEPAVGPAPTETTTPTTITEPPTLVAPETVSSTDPAASSSTIPPTSPPPVTTASSVTSVPSSSVLDVRFGALPKVVDGATIVPNVGPPLRVDQRGTGSIEAVAGGGWRFLPGGQQRYDYAVITKVGADVQALVPVTGKAVATFVPLVSMTGRSVPTGRNIQTWFEVVSEEGPDHPVLSMSLQVDPEIGPYLAATIQGVNVEHTLTDAEQSEFDAGRTVQLAAEWTGSEGRLTLNGRLIAKVALPGPGIVWKPTARLSIGGSATWGGGYFSVHDDAYRSFVIAG
jgi:hypothetical protein